MHTPVQAPFTQAEEAQVTGAPYCPLVLQVSTPLAEHVVAPGAQTPVHVPATHAEFAHGEGSFTHEPDESQV